MPLLTNRPLFNLSALMWTVMCGLALGKVASESYFIGYIDTISFPILLIVNGILLLGVVFFYSLFQSRIGRFQLMTWLMAFFALFLILFQFLLIQSGGGALGVSDQVTGSYRFLPYVSFALYEIILLIFQIHFWTCANEVFGPAEGKKYFPWLGGIGLIGTIVGGFGAGFLANKIGHFALFLSWTGFAILSVFFAYRLQKKRLSSRARKIEERLIISWEDFQNYPLLRLLASLSIPLWISLHSIDWLFYYAINEIHPGDLQATSSLIGYLNGFSTILGFILQIGITGWVLKKWGVGVAYSSQPLAVFFASLSLVARSFTQASTNLFGLRNFLAMLTRLLDEPFLYSLYDAATQLLFGAIPERIRGQARTFIFGILEPGLTLAAGLLFLFFEMYDFPRFTLAIFVLTLSFVWFILSWQVKDKYLRTFMISLREQGSRYERMSSLLDTEKAKPNQKISLELLQSLTSKDEQVALLAIEYLAASFSDDRLSAVYGKMREMTDAVFHETLRIIREKKLGSAAKELQHFIENGGERGADALRTLWVIAPKESTALFPKYLKTMDRYMFSEAILYYLRTSQGESRAKYIAMYKRFLLSSHGIDRRLALEINAVMEEPVLFDEVVAIFRSTSSHSEIRLGLRVLEKRPTKKAMQAMLELLPKKELRVQAIQSLKNISQNRPWIQDQLIRQYYHGMKQTNSGAIENGSSHIPLHTMQKGATDIHAHNNHIHAMDPLEVSPKALLPKILSFSEKKERKEMREGLIYALQAIGNEYSFTHLIEILAASSNQLDLKMKDLMVSGMLTIRQRMMESNAHLSTEAVQKMRKVFIRAMRTLRFYGSLKHLADDLTGKDQGHSKNEKTNSAKAKASNTAEVSNVATAVNVENIVYHLSQSLTIEIDLQFELNLKILTMCWKNSDLDFLFPMLRSEDSRERAEAIEIAKNIEDLKTETSKEEFPQEFRALLSIVETGYTSMMEDAKNRQREFDKESLHFLIEQSQNVWLGMLGLMIIGATRKSSRLLTLLRYKEEQHSLLRYAALWSLIELGYEQYRKELQSMALKIELVIFLKTVPIFAEVDADDIVLLSEISKVIRYRNNTELFREGNPGQEFFVVKKGTVGIYKDKVMIAEVKERDCFGEMAIVEDRARSATAKTMESAELILFDRSDFLKLMMSQPRITYSLFVNANKRLRDLHHKVLQTPRE